jgi:hypothetical protein
LTLENNNYIEEECCTNNLQFGHINQFVQAKSSTNKEAIKHSDGHIEYVHISMARMNYLGKARI